jgi:hypothetical protein
VEFTEYVWEISLLNTYIMIIVVFWNLSPSAIGLATETDAKAKLRIKASCCVSF